MTMIDITRTAEQLAAIEESKKKCGRLYEEAVQNIEQLNNVSGMELVRRTLEHILEDVQEEYQLLEQMSRCLEETCKAYSMYENRIADFAEEASSVNSREQILGVVRIPENLLRLLR